MIDRLKRMLAEARRNYDEWKHRRTGQQRNRRKARRARDAKLEERRDSLHRRKFLEKAYNQLKPPGEGASDEEIKDFELKAHLLKSKLRDEIKRTHRLDDNLKDISSRIRDLSAKITHATRRIRWFTSTRLPNVRRRLAKAIREAQNDGWSATGGRIVTFDGKPCAEWLAFRCRISRSAGWNGYLNSGYRTPEYSEQLCYNMCGQPTCPGRCAGRYSNHAKKTYPYGAVDVGDYYNFGALQRALDGRVPGVVIFNALGAADPVHFSSSGR